MIATTHNGRFVTINGKKFLNFSTTGYLGLAHHNQFQSFYIEGIKQYGTAYGSSPLSNPQLSIYHELEALLANFYGFESALLFSSGYAASQAIISLYQQKGFAMSYGKFYHPSLVVEQIEQSYNKQAFVTNIADPIHCKITTIAAIQQPLILDASHGFGILDSAIQQTNKKNTVICGSLNKALATPCGLVLCSASIKTELQQLPSYNTSSPAPPAACYALREAIQTGLVTTQQEKLTNLLSLIAPNHKGYEFTPPLPILKLTDKSKSVFEKFYATNGLIWHNEYPKGTNEHLNRIVLHAALEVEDVELLQIID